MSSRSIGVTNVEFRRWMMSCVIRSPSCSQIDDLARRLGLVGPVLEHALQKLRRPDDVGSRLLEQVEELALLGREQLRQAAPWRRSVGPRVKDL